LAPCRTVQNKYKPFNKRG